MNEILLYGSVGSSFWEEEYFTAQQVREQLADMTGPVTIRINSGGGIATEGQAIYTALKNYAGQVDIVIDGIAASAASLIAMAGDTITMPLGSIMMIHDPAGWYVEGRGTEDDHLQAATGLRVLANAYAGIYAKQAGIGKDAARDIMKAETYYDGPTAVEAGFATAADDDAEADAPTAFDYRIYPKAPDALLTIAGSLPRARTNQLVMAMMVGTSIPTLKGNKMAKQNAQPKATLAKTTLAETTEIDDQVATLEVDEEDQVDEDTDQTDDEDVTAETEDDMVDDEEDATAALAASEMSAIINMCVRRDLGIADAKDFITRGLTCKQAVAELNSKGKPVAKISKAPSARIMRDERDTRRAGMTDALVAQIGRQRDVTGPARQYMGMSIAEMAAASIDHRGPLRDIGQKMKVFEMASHATSDFPAIFQNALNKELLARYTVAAPTYREISKQKNFRDFRPMPLVRTGDFPTLKPIGEGGEIKWGTFGESGEVAAISSYAVGVTISRQMMVNDDLGAIDEVLGSYGNTVAMFEERMFYAFALTAVMSDGQQVFHASHGNLAGAGAAINTTSVSAGRAAMRKQKSLDGISLNIAPTIILVGPDKETEAEMFVAAITPAAAADVNPFSGKLRPVVTPEITGNAWHLLSAANPCWVHGFLEGLEAPRLRTEEPFGTQGFSMTLEHDFGLGVVEHRGGYRNPGA